MNNFFAMIVCFAWLIHQNQPEKHENAEMHKNLNLLLQFTKVKSYNNHTF